MSAKDGVFILTSCRYPAGMLDGLHAPEEHRRAGSGTLRGGAAREWLPGPADRSQFRMCAWYDQAVEGGVLERTARVPIIGAGDQVYVDATAGLFDPASRKARFSKPHRERTTGRLPAAARLKPFAPRYDIPDDHEIDDNWEPTVVDAEGNRDLMERGRRAYIRHFRLHAAFRQASPQGRPDQLWCEAPAPIAGCRFFFCDTRTEREHRTAATVHQRHIFSDEQLDALLAWLRLRDPEGRPRFVVSPAMLLPRRLFRADRDAESALRCDAWEGYPRSLHAVLQTLYEEDLSDVIFLSGDEHLSNLARIVLSGGADRHETRVHSIHSSPLYGPFTFANARIADFAGRETFRFPVSSSAASNARFNTLGTWLQCDVETDFIDHGDSFCAVRVVQRDGGWRITVEFVPANGALSVVREIVLPQRNG